VLHYHFCRVLLGIIDIPSFIPMSSRDVLALNCDVAGPPSTSACKTVSGLHSKASIDTEEGLTTFYQKRSGKPGGAARGGPHGTFLVPIGIVTARHCEFLPSSLSCQVSGSDCNSMRGFGRGFGRSRSSCVSVTNRRLGTNDSSERATGGNTVCAVVVR
jgi:hypothetical protein